MHTSYIPHLSAAILFACCAIPAAAEIEHREFEATLFAPFHGDPKAPPARPDARHFTLIFDYPGMAQPKVVDWRVDLIDPAKHSLINWRGTRTMRTVPVTETIAWDGRVKGRAPAPGVYTVRMRASVRGDPPEDAVEQAWDVDVGPAAAAPMPRLEPLPSAHKALAPRAAPSTGALPYTVYYGNLHSQTNHSDGGADLASCNGAQQPQTGRYGPADAYAFARGRGLDILMTSEHNHMFDGSDVTNLDADAGHTKGLYQQGLAAARDFNAANPGFLAIYGMEWGVIANGGHLNIFNSNELLGWEKNAKGELLADTLSARSDYAGLYTLMKQRGWIGQFNHPSISGQFIVNGVPLAYTPDGDEVMAMCEVLNSTAFSANDSETETRRSNFEMACNRLLEAGYHVAFSSDQDNHCANWGVSYTNRTGVLIPAGTALTLDSFLEAVRARRVFATMDKESQLVLTANGRLMGERFANSGPLALVANFASSAGKTVAAVAIMEGVPGRNGTVTQLASSGTATITPAPGEHFYYAKVTQSDGNLLWSAPVWVTQSAPLAAKGR
ncbi:CehA/McbA family metallohydrolase [Massilia terrae]|uniref:CehA/McbA family metallohydrolase n=1 Tax=Massilia terrae TaxID=1811224 RepID=A0ABT2CXR8_9BURK|nr:CehA/McbA family metallohydrolase [Massilia terrae]MCS0658757.1 CehA/McbA family metallohydrolase [Massilia terrae]